ncbi:MAG: hypothetical protein IT374_24175 [Polyangiaceae bacterium]|nr:hypothetical protein [Polyangiaceae bacterium]
MLVGVRGVATLSVLLAACGSGSPAAYTPEPAVIDRLLAAPSTSGSPPRSAPPAPTPRRIVDAPERSPRSGRRITLSVSRAPLGEVVRLLATEAGLDVVLASALEQEVSLDVRRADPLIVLDALASAHSLALERNGRALIVRPRGP